MLDVNKAGSVHKRLFLRSEAPFFLCSFAVMNYSVITVGILIILQVSVQPVTVMLLGLGKKDRYKVMRESGGRETWRLHKAMSHRLETTLWELVISSKMVIDPGLEDPGLACLLVAERQ